MNHVRQANLIERYPNFNTFLLLKYTQDIIEEE